MGWLADLLTRTSSKNPPPVDKTRLTLEFSDSSLEVMQWCAQRRKMTLEEWMHFAIERQIPGNAAALHYGESMAAAARDAAFRQLDENSSPQPRDPLPILSSSVDASLFEERKKTAPNGTPIIDGNHPCYHLNPEQLPMYAGLSEGICKHPKQPGRICYWSASSARQCLVFEPRVIPKI